MNKENIQSVEAKLRNYKFYKYNIEILKAELEICKKKESNKSKVETLENTLDEQQLILCKIENTLNMLKEDEKDLIIGFYIQGVKMKDLVIRLDQTYEHLFFRKKSILIKYFSNLI